MRQLTGWGCSAAAGAAAAAFVGGVDLAGSVSVTQATPLGPKDSELWRDPVFTIGPESSATGGGGGPVRAAVPGPIAIVGVTASAVWTSVWSRRIASEESDSCDGGALALLPPWRWNLLFLVFCTATRVGWLVGLTGASRAVLDSYASMGTGSEGGT